MEDLAIGITTIVLLFGTPLFLALIGFGAWQAHSIRKQREVERARESYERLAREKLDVIKTAIAMGHSDEQIRELDARLERLVGADKLAGLLNPKQPSLPKPDPELRDTDLLAEIERQRRSAMQDE